MCEKLHFKMTFSQADQTAYDRKILRLLQFRPLGCKWSGKEKKGNDRCRVARRLFFQFWMQMRSAANVEMEGGRSVNCAHTRVLQSLRNENVFGKSCKDVIFKSKFLWAVVLWDLSGREGKSHWPSSRLLQAFLNSSLCIYYISSMKLS